MPSLSEILKDPKKKKLLFFSLISLVCLLFLGGLMIFINISRKTDTRKPIGTVLKSSAGSSSTSSQANSSASQTSPANSQTNSPVSSLESNNSAPQSQTQAASATSAAPTLEQELQSFQSLDTRGKSNDIAQDLEKEFDDLLVGLDFNENELSDENLNLE